MNEKDKLILQLQNLKKSKSRQVTLDIDFLLSVLQTGFVTEVKRVTPIEIFNKVDVDGGGFNEE